MMLLGIILIVVGSILVYWAVPFSPEKLQFDKIISTKMAETPNADSVYTKEDIEKLPEALQRYFNYINCVGKPKHNAVRVMFQDVYFNFDSKERIMSINYEDWLFADVPFRMAFITASMFGVPFNGTDYLLENEGGMKGIIGKVIKIFDIHNERMYVAGLLTWLGEGTCNPAILLSDYIEYKQIDESHVEATVSYNGLKGTGTFTIDKQGRITKFESMEREVAEIDGSMIPINWYCEYMDYIPSVAHDEILMPSNVSISKGFPDRDVVYFKSDDFELTFYK